MSEIDGIFSQAFRGIFFNKERTPEEKAIAESFKDSLKARLEVRTPVGVVDLVSDAYGMIAEIKAIKNWKHAIGQVLVYQYYFKDKCPMVILFGETDDSYRDMVRFHADRLGVAVMFARGLSEDAKKSVREGEDLRKRINSLRDELASLTKTLAETSQFRLEI